MDKLKIVNIALLALGQPVTTSLLDLRNSVTVILAHYDQARDVIQSSYRWTFCTDRKIIQKDSENIPAFGWGSFYPFPSDLLRLISIENNDYNYELENNGILCDNTNDMNIKYIKRVEDESKFSPAFVDAFALELAIRANENTTQNNSLFKILTARQLNAITLAKKIDAIQRPPIKQVSYEVEGDRIV